MAERLASAGVTPLLYVTDLSPFGARLRLTSAFVGDPPAEATPPGGAGSDAMKAISYFGKAPALDTGDRVLIESIPLMEYLVERAGGSPLIPEDIVERAMMRGVMATHDFHVLGAVWPMLLQLRTGKPDMAVVKPALAAAVAQYQVLTRMFEGDTGFVLGDRITLADLAIAPFALLFGATFPMFGEPSPFVTIPRLSAWRDRTFAEPRVGAVMEKMDAALSRAFGR